MTWSEEWDEDNGDGDGREDHPLLEFAIEEWGFPRDLVMGAFRSMVEKDNLWNWELYEKVDYMAWNA
eukprot:scaffold302378_cov41-Prasinocladus_malaysianus.AAC.2